MWSVHPLPFATKQLKLTAKSPQRLIPEIQKICNAIEDGIEIVEKESAVRSHEAVAAKGDVGAPAP